MSNQRKSQWYSIDALNKTEPIKEGYEMSQDHQELADSPTSPVDATGNLDIAGKIEDVGKSSCYPSSDEDRCSLSVYPLARPGTILKPGPRINVAIQRDHSSSKWVKVSADPLLGFRRRRQCWVNTQKGEVSRGTIFGP